MKFPAPASLRLAALASVLGLANCASMVSYFRGEEPGTTEVAGEESDRAPASNGKAITLDNSSGLDAKSFGASSDPSGPNLGKNEFNAMAKRNDEKASKGYRRDVDPWEGTGPVNEGSLWNGDTQDNYYFTKNVLRKVGDIVIIKVEPDVNDAMNSRIDGIVGRTSVQQVAADEAGKSVATAVGDRVGNAAGNKNIGDAVGGAVGNRTTAALQGSTKYIDVDEIPARIIELLPKGTVKVEGSRRVNIKGAPYNLKLSGIVRDDDIGPTAMVQTSKLVESKMELTR